MPCDEVSSLASVQPGPAENMAMFRQPVAFREVKYDVRCGMAKKLDPPCEQDWRMVAHHLGFRSEDIDWLPQHADANKQTNAMFLLKIYCDLSGNCVQNMAAALYLCNRLDVLGILFGQFGLEATEDVMQVCIDMSDTFKLAHPDGMHEPLVQLRHKSGTLNCVEPMEFEMHPYAHGHSYPLSDPHEEALDLTNGDAMFPHAGAPGAYFSGSRRKHAMDTEDYGRRVSDGSPTVIKYARSNSQMTDVRACAIPEDTMRCGQSGAYVNGPNRASPRPIPNSGHSTSSSIQGISESWPQRAEENSMPTSSVPKTIPLAKHIQPPAPMIHIVIMYSRISKEHMKLIHDEFEAFNKKSFLIASLKPSDKFDCQEIEEWVQKSDFILVFVSDLLKKVVECCGTSPATKHGNVGYMYEAMARQLRRDPSKRDSYIPILLPGVSQDCIPQLFAPRPGDVYHLPEDRKNLHFRLNQPEKIVRNFVKRFPTVVTEYVGNSLPCVRNGLCFNNNNNNHKAFNSLPIS